MSLLDRNVKFLEMYSDNSYLYSDSSRYSESGTGKYSESHRETNSTESSSQQKKASRPLDPPDDLYPLDSVWTPASSFPGLFVHVDEKGNLVVSGPREYMEAARQQVHDIILQNLNLDVTNDIRTIEFQGQP